MAPWPCGRDDSLQDQRVFADTMDAPVAQVRPPRPSASVMLWRGEEILVCHRVSEVPAFPDYWAFPGGGVSRADRAALDQHPEWFPKRDQSERAALVALMREIVEEVGLVSSNGIFNTVNSEIRESILNDKNEWNKFVEKGELAVDDEGFCVISERITPPLAPLRFHNHFFAAECKVDPIVVSGGEFDQFRWATPQQLLDEWTNNEIRIPPPLIMILRDLIGHTLSEGIAKMVANPPTENIRIEFGPGVECIPLATRTLPPSTHTNCYILGEPSGERIIIDPAAREVEALGDLQSKINAIIEDGSTIIATIFTHRHTDHIGDLDAISQIYQAPIWATSETMSVLPASESNRVISEGESFVLRGPNGEIGWEIIETPGHCPGQICLVGEAGIISADNVAQVGTILVPSGEGCMSEYIQGLYRLRNLSPRLLFPGHGPVVTNPHRLLSHYIKHRESRHEAVFAAVTGGLTELSEIADAAYLDTPDAHPHLKLDQTQSHLNALSKEGRI